MKYIYIGDLHLGYKRKSFTSPSANGRYREAIMHHAIKAGQIAKGSTIQVGDVFDKFRDSDETLMDGASICRGLSLVLAGNHDISNTLDDDSTMNMCRELLKDTSDTYFCFPSKLGDSSRTVFSDPATKVSQYLVPYCYTQEQFLLSLEEAEASVKIEANDGWVHILVLHTNYNMAFEMTETTINLTKERAEQLLEKFDYIISGHEHNYNSHLGGRLIMTGSVFPVSTAELENKYVHIFDSKTRKFTKEVIWEAKAHAFEYDINKLPTTLPDNAQFVTITGRAGASDVAAGQKSISAWWGASKTLLVCKPEYEVITEQRKVVSAVKTDMVSHIRGLLKPSAKKLLDTMVLEINNDV